MAAEIGEKAPDFTLKTKNLTGEVKDVKLSDYKGKNVVLLFYSQAFTGTCADEMCPNENVMDMGKLNAEVLGIGVDSVFTQEAWSKQMNLKYPLLSDFNREVIKQYGVEFAPGEFVFGMNGVSRRAAFLIDKEGVIRYKDVAKAVGDLPDFEKLKDAAAGLK